MKVPRLLAVAMLACGIARAQEWELDSNALREAFHAAVRYNTVQEQSTNAWSNSSVAAGMPVLSTSPTVRARFTGWSVPGGTGKHLAYDVAYATNVAAFSHCRFGGGHFSVAPGSVGLTNCLWERVSLTLDDNAYYDVKWYLFNKLFYGGKMYYRAAWINPVLRAYDNLFDRMVITKDPGSYSVNFVRNYNGYVTNQTRLTPNGTHDVVLTNTSYQIGPLGNYYLPTNGPLINAGSRDAYAAGLYHFTTTTNQAKETNSVVDTGFHYFPVVNGVASDLDGDGTPDHADADAEPPFIVAQTQPDRYWTSPSAPLLLWVSASGAPFLNYQWKLFGTNILGARSTNYMVSFNASEERLYSCTVENAVGVTTSQTWKVRALIEGSIAAWGANGQGQLERPATATNVIAVAAGGRHSLAAREDGSVLGWGLNDSGQTNAPTLTNAIAVAAGNKHSLALRDNGAVVAWGRNAEGQTNVPSGLTNVMAIAANGNQSLALLRNGTVTNWGQTFGTIPSNLTNAITIAAGTNFCLALRSNGTVVAWGNNANGQTNVPAGLTNVVGIAAGDFHSLALKENGTIVAWGNNASGQTNVPSGLSNVMAVAAGRAHSVALKNDGTVVAWGDNSTGQTNIGSGLKGIKLLAAGGDHTLASAFSPLVQYQVDVSKDLLLIYNTNSLDSLWVKNYYLSNRPMAGGANSLGIACSTNEITSPSAFTNEILQPYLNWLGQNPTKRPQYLVAFLDIPACVHDTTHVYDSVFYQLHTKTPSYRPFVTTINMNGTNDCRAYIDKLAAFGTNGQVTISASRGDYPNTNYVVDNVFSSDSGDVVENAYAISFLRAATNGLLTAGVSSNSISYLELLEFCTQWVTNIVNGQTNKECVARQIQPHLTNAVNVAGYISWGAHSSLSSFYAVDGKVKWTGQSGWWIIETIESFNGRRQWPQQGHFMQWYSATAFGGTNYSNTPVGAVTHVDEPNLSGVNNPQAYFGLWASGKNFAIAAWNSRITQVFQAVGDPLVTK